MAKFPFGQGCAAERQVVAFGSAGCEDDLLGGASQNFRNRAPGVLDGSFGRLAPTMDRGRVAEGLLEVGEHGLQDTWIGRGRGSVVQIHVPGNHEAILSCRGAWTPVPVTFRSRHLIRESPLGLPDGLRGGCLKGTRQVIDRRGLTGFLQSELGKIACSVRARAGGGPGRMGGRHHRVRRVRSRSLPGEEGRFGGSARTAGRRSDLAGGGRKRSRGRPVGVRRPAGAGAEASRRGKASSGRPVRVGSAVRS